MKKSFQNIIEDYFNKHERITTSEAYSLFKIHMPKINKSTVNWRLYELVKRGIIKRAGRGIYLAGERKVYHPVLSKEIKTISQLIHTTFPLISYCIWSTDNIKEFAQHIPAVSYTVVDVEQDGLSAVRNRLKENYENVYNGNSKLFIQEMLPDLPKAILIKTLVSEAPIKVVDDVPSPLPEKMLVDIFCDSTIFDYLQGNELIHIYRNVMDRFTVNTTSLLRYAARRGKKREINGFLNQIIGNKTDLLLKI